MFSQKSRWQDWARDWGLTHLPQAKHHLYRNEGVVGLRKGLILRAAWTGEKGVTLSMKVRFPRGESLEGLKQALADDPALDVLPGKGAARRKTVIAHGPAPRLRLGAAPEFRLADGLLEWNRPFAWRTPKPAQVMAWADALVNAVARAGVRFDGRCEECRTAATGGYVLVNDLPRVLCGSCQQRLIAEGEMAERWYDMQEASYWRGATLGAVTAFGGAAAWAMLAILSDRIWAVAAIGIGALVAWAYQRGAGKVDRMGQVVAGALTFGSIVLGDVSFFAWIVAKQRPDIGYDLTAGWTLYTRVWSRSPIDQAVSLVFALVGVWVAARALERQRLAPLIRRPGELSGPTEKRAA